MSLDSSANNKRIAKNTLLLYFRMLLTMVVSLYTSRVVLGALGVNMFVVHDEDSGTPGAVVMNAPILQALDNNETKRLMMHNCIEDELGYPAPSSDKPFKAYQHVKDWKTWEDVPENWREKMKIVFHEYSEQL